MLFPQFLSGPNGHLFVNLYLPPGDKIPTCWVLHVPGFAEEMNKSRHMVQQQARDLTLQGVAVMVPDLYGTGDSEGDFGEAEWVLWKQDIECLVTWAKQRGAVDVVLWGLRLGCLLAVDFANSNPGCIHKLVLWQPVVSGQQAMTQFLRVRMAAGLMEGDGESVSQLRERLNSGETLEIAGYDISNLLFTQISNVALNNFERPAVEEVDWYEVVQSERKSLGVQAKKIIQHWSDADIAVKAETVHGEPFWITQELSGAPDLITRTTANLTVAESTIQGTVVERSTLLNEIPTVFSCNDNALIGVLHKPRYSENRAILVVVGGPQYRVGSHRQFVLLSRYLANHGVTVFRFDYRGMGDSDGLYSGFDNIQDDIRSAIDALIQISPNIEEVVIWGLCDAASAASFYARSDNRVTGLVLLNPWVRSESGEAKAYLKHYYLQRFFSKGFWRKMFKGEFRFINSLKSLNKIVRGAASSTQQRNSKLISNDGEGLVARMEQGLSAFKGNALFIMSENDLTAAEFRDAVKGSKKFTQLLTQSRFKWAEIAGADHTFSRREWRDQVSDLTEKWLKEW